MICTTRPESSTSALLSREVDDILLHARGLALVRDVLAERGASSAEIRAHSDALERLRGQLADLIRA
jgi:hypothetical protein